MNKSTWKFQNRKIYHISKRKRCIWWLVFECLSFQDMITGNLTSCILAEMRRLLTCGTCLLLNPNPLLHHESLPCSPGNLRSRQRVHREPKGSLLSPEAACVLTLPATSSLQSRRESRFTGRKEKYRIFTLDILMALVLAGALCYSFLAL